MKKLLLIYIVLLFVLGCKSKEKKFDDLEIMVYRYGYTLPNDTIESAKFYVKCFTYALIENNDQNKMLVHDYFTQSEIKYFSVDIDKNKLHDLVDSMLSLKDFTVFKYKNYCLYDGPTIKMRLNKGEITKTVSFINRFDSSYSFYMNFYQYIDSLCRTKKYTNINDSILIVKRKDKFINWTFNIDTINLPLPIIRKPPFVAPDYEDIKHPKKHPKKD